MDSELHVGFVERGASCRANQSQISIFYTSSPSSKTRVVNHAEFQPSAAHWRSGLVVPISFEDIKAFK